MIRNISIILPLSASYDIVCCHVRVQMVEPSGGATGMATTKRLVNFCIMLREEVLSSVEPLETQVSELQVNEISGEI